MILPVIQGDVGISKNSFYFGCDRVYFNTYGKPLINSIKKFAPWANIHAHIFNPLPEQIVYCKNIGISCSYEYVDQTINEINTYYACVRFIRIPEIFNFNTRIISFDCDGIAVKELPQQLFLEETNVSKITWRAKHQRSLASTVFFGPDDFRIRYADKLKSYFEEDKYYWFLDQDVMDIMVKANEIGYTETSTWGNHKMRSDTLIWTGKGDTKFNQNFLDHLKLYS
jgi:hypothetical protein